MFLHSTSIFAQEAPDKRQHLSVMVGYGLVPLGENGETKQNLIVPALGLDYNYSITPSVSVGIVSDIELSNYIIEKDSTEVLQRQNAFLCGLSIDVKAYKNFKAGTAIAREFERHKNLWVLRFQAEYEIEMNEQWYVAPIFAYNFKEQYDTWMLGVNIGRNF